MASLEIFATGLLISRLNRTRKCSARSGMSSFRERSGGTWMGITLRR